MGVTPDILVEEIGDNFKINTDSDNQLNYALNLFNSKMSKTKLPLEWRRDNSFK